MRIKYQTFQSKSDLNSEGPLLSGFLSRFLALESTSLLELVGTGAHREITDGLMDLPGRVFGVGELTGAFHVSHDVYRGRSDPELN